MHNLTFRATDGAFSTDSSTHITKNAFSSARSKVQKLFGAAAVMLLASAGSAYAITATTIDITYTVTYTPSTVVSSGHTYAQGNSPQINHAAPSNVRHYLGTYVSNSGSPGKYHTTKDLTPGAPATALEYFLTVNPVSSGSDSGCGSHCVNHTAAGVLTVDFTFIDPTTGVTGTLTETGYYSAKYSGSFLSCSNKNGSGQSDCVEWSATSGSTLGSLVSDSVTFAVALGTDTLNVTFKNAEDWTIYPKISFQLESNPVSQTPLPGALPLFVSGAGMLGFFGWRRKKQKGNATTVAAN